MLLYLQEERIVSGSNSLEQDNSGSRHTLGQDTTVLTV
jgi:hypothetical protein